MLLDTVMRVLGFDPGASPGWGVVDFAPAPAPCLVACGVIKSDIELRIVDRVTSVYCKINCLIGKYKPLAVASEIPFSPRGAGRCEAGFGAFYAAAIAAMHSQLPFYEYTPVSVKRAVCGPAKVEVGDNGKRRVLHASKSDMQDMVAEILRLKNRITPNHANDAVAVSISHFLSVKGHSNDK